MIDEKMLALENLHSCMMVKIGDSDMQGIHASMRLADQALHLAELSLIPKLNALCEMAGKETDWYKIPTAVDIL